MAKDNGSKRDKTLSIDLIDEDYISNLVRDSWILGNQQRDAFLLRREKYEASWRDLTVQESSGPWENSANFKPPHTLIYGKAIHARLWQLFSNPQGFFEVQSRQEVFKDNEQAVKQFMNFILSDYCNSKHGIRRELDRWLWDVVFQGSGFFKCFWKKEASEYMEVESVVDVEEEKIFNAASPTGRSIYKTTVKEKEVRKTDILETPQIRRVLSEDIVMPVGEHDPQESPWVANRVFMDDATLKQKVENGIFNEEAVKESIDMKERITQQGDVTSDIKQDRQQIDGYENQLNNPFFSDGYHVIYEWYGKAYITKKYEDEVEDDLSEFPQEIIAWVHKGSGRVLGWTYLSRVSPGGIRPIFKADLVTFPDRSHGVGVPELLYENQRHIQAVNNMRVDNGMLSGTPMFAYRASSGLKPGTIRVKPGQGIPVDDINDIRVLQFPFLQGFGYQEESLITSYSERLLAISEINLGRAPEKVGALRNATGSNLLASEGNIQLEIHFDRVAYCMSRMLQFLFRLCRERIPSDLYYRVTGELGQPIFGKVDRENLKGEYDFSISVDILGQSQLEKQQMAVLAMNTMMNPAFMQTGVVSPANLYNLAKNFLRAHKIGRVDDYISEPQGYEGDMISPHERIFRIVVNSYMNPPIEDTVRLSENHEKALQVYESFKNTDEFGLLTSPEQLAALARLEQRHQQMLAAQQAPGNPNITGQQIPREGFGPIGPGGQGSEALLQNVGMANGPVS